MHTKYTITQNKHEKTKAMFGRLALTIWGSETWEKNGPILNEVSK